ncbi:MAG: hypothetical protein HPY85_16830 [Anaerolineae bacterium]|nr:hypothetical protein [Anaerolineae bacterium]
MEDSERKERRTDGLWMDDSRANLPGACRTLRGAAPAANLTPHSAAHVPPPRSGIGRLAARPGRAYNQSRSRKGITPWMNTGFNTTANRA